ncbi:hypothetical protein [Dickeya sp. NCPPB 3274]|uniref:hypothetical protein n=1 Tax=Dickeya sp. NCPPB 3274 TaxID=568766 RepID=UPI0005B35ABF|nr:hypothetical protein [Dickeya sp. NCPPB 3274]
MGNNQNFVQKREKEKILNLLLLFSRSREEVAYKTADALVGSRPNKDDPTLNVQIFRSRRRIDKIEKSIKRILPFFTGLYAKENGEHKDKAPNPVIISSNNENIIAGYIFMDCITGESVGFRSHEFYILDESGYKKIDIFGGVGEN